MSRVIDKNFYIGNIHIQLKRFDQQNADAIEGIFEEDIEKIHAMWGLPTPKSIKAYNLNSRLSFILCAFPWFSYPLIVFLPFFRFCYPNKWADFISSYEKGEGWTFACCGNIRIGVNRGKCVDLKKTICHELLHAHTKRLNLPRFFLDEGLAQLTPEKLFRTPSREISTLASLNMPSQDRSLEENYDYSYWIVKYLDEIYPDLLRKVIAFPRKRAEYDGLLFASLGLPADSYQELQKKVFTYFSGKGPNQIG